MEIEKLGDTLHVCSLDAGDPGVEPFLELPDCCSDRIDVSGFDCVDCSWGFLDGWFPDPVWVEREGFEFDECVDDCVDWLCCLLPPFGFEDPVLVPSFAGGVDVVVLDVFPFPGFTWLPGENT